MTYSVWYKINATYVRSLNTSIGYIVIITSYRSFSVNWHRNTSGVEMIPQCLNRPSPIERDTSSVPITRPSLEKEEEQETELVNTKYW